jgi:hypothetical protein
VGAVLVAVVFASPASAQEAEEDEEVVAEEAVDEEAARDDETSRIHFQAGRAHFDAGRYEDALGEFVRAYEISHRPELLYNIGLTHERLANYAEAADALEEFNQGKPEPDPVLTERIANLRLRAEELAAPEEPEEPEAVPPPPQEVDDGSGGVPMGAIISYAVAGAGLATFGVFGALALAEDSNLAGSCGADAGRTCGDDDVSTLQTFSIVADIGLGVAVVGAIVGTVLLLVGGGGDDAQVAVAPAIGPDVVGVSARGAF